MRRGWRTILRKATTLFIYIFFFVFVICYLVLYHATTHRFHFPFQSQIQFQVTIPGYHSWLPFLVAIPGYSLQFQSIFSMPVMFSITTMTLDVIYKLQNCIRLKHSLYCRIDIYDSHTAPLAILKTTKINGIFTFTYFHIFLLWRLI